MAADASAVVAGRSGSAVEAKHYDPAASGIVAHGLTKRFGNVAAVRGASFTLPSRGVCGLLGPNGAGKTTTIRMIAGVLSPDSGELTVAGISARTHPNAVRAAIGYLPESAPLYPELTVREYLVFRQALVDSNARGGARARGERIDEAMRRCDVASFADRLCGALSKGMQQRVGLAATILSDAKVLILDEPSVGLDPSQILAFRELIRSLGTSHLVLLSSHQLAEVESVCSELLLIAHGHVVVQESMDAFRARARSGKQFRVESERSLHDRDGCVGVCGDVSMRTLQDGWIETTFSSADERAAEVVARAALREQIAIRLLERLDRRLEEVFVSLVEGAANT